MECGTKLIQGIAYILITWSWAIEQEMPGQSQGSESRASQFVKTRSGSSYIALLNVARA